MAAEFRLTNLDRDRLREAIRTFEHETSAEIKIAIVNARKGDAIELAREEFQRLKLYKTQLRNAVLVCVFPKLRRVVVWGDEGIHQAVPAGTWDQIVETIVREFREGRFHVGLANAIEEVGKLFAEYFPYQTDDVNEISDEIVEEEDTEPDAEAEARPTTPDAE